MDSKKALLWATVVSVFLVFLIWLLAPQIQHYYKLPDQGPAWYYWKLAYPTLITRISAWVPYLLHQISFWVLIYLAQKQKTKYSVNLNKFNIWALAMNLFFGLLHIAQTYFFYDGLAQDVSVFSSQASVIVMLIWIIFMTNYERGIIFGKQLNFKKSAILFARKYHGYIFAWATVYTFWFHPTEAPWGQLLGFFYMFMLFIQGSLFFTTTHLNKYWRTFLEVFVLFHGVVVAILQGASMWPMFLFGFWGAFILIYMWGLNWSRLVKILNIVIYVIAWFVIWGIMGFAKSYSTIFIPLTYYLAVFALYAILLLVVKLIKFKPVSSKAISN